MSKFFVDFNEINKQAEEAASAHSGIYFSQKEIPAGAEQVVRILPPLKNMLGNFYVTEKSYWINKKNYISPKTFGAPCPIEAIVKKAQASGNPTVIALLGDKDIYNTAERYLLPIVLLNPSYNGPQLVDAGINKNPKIFACSWQVIDPMIKAVTHRAYQNGTPMGIFDFEKGHNMWVSKEVKGSKTSYAVTVDPQPMKIPVSVSDNMPDVVAELQKKVYSPSYLEGVINNFLYGSPMPSDDQKFVGGSAAVAANTAPSPKAEAPVVVADTVVNTAPQTQAAEVVETIAQSPDPVQPDNPVEQAKTFAENALANKQADPVETEAKAPVMSMKELLEKQKAEG